MTRGQYRNCQLLAEDSLFTKRNKTIIIYKRSSCKCVTKTCVDQYVNFKIPLIIPLPYILIKQKLNSKKSKESK